MGDMHSTVYSADPHTQAKHQILRAYLTAWSIILGRQSQKMGRAGSRLLYVDGFAGAGVYEGEVPGSPLVAIDVFSQHATNIGVPVKMTFVELREDRADHLSRMIQSKVSAPEFPSSLAVDPKVRGDCETRVRAMISDHEDKRLQLGPALFFLDQFGYSSIPMDLLSSILRHPICEAFTYMNWGRLCPFMADPSKHEGLTKAIGGDEWKDVLRLSGSERENHFKNLYLAALRNRGGAKYAFPFTMRDQNQRLIYWLFFCTSSRKGLFEMKKAMWSVDGSGSFEFSDRHANQIGTMYSYDESALADDLVGDLVGKTLTVDEIEDHVLLHTPAYNYKSALKKLEQAGRLEVVDAPASRRRWAFNDPSMKVHFCRKAATDELGLFDRHA